MSEVLVPLNRSDPRQNTKQQSATFELGADPDVLAYDPGPTRLCVAGEHGVMSMFQISAAGARKIADRLVGLNAHAVAVDRATHENYFPLKDLDGKSVMRVMKPAS
jgi:hypothetical protein